MLQIILIISGGAIGAYLRYILISQINVAKNNYVNSSNHMLTENLSLVNILMLMPWPVFAVNMVGSLLIGILFALMNHGLLSANTYLFLAVGLLGGFTTFSTMMLDGMVLLQNNMPAIAMIYLISSVILGMIMIFVGYIITDIVYQKV